MRADKMIEGGEELSVFQGKVLFPQLNLSSSSTLVKMKLIVSHYFDLKTYKANNIFNHFKSSINLNKDLLGDRH